MRAIIAAGVALALLAAVAGTSYAADDFGRDFWKKQERNLP